MESNTTTTQTNDAYIVSERTADIVGCLKSEYNLYEKVRQTMEKHGSRGYFENINAAFDSLDKLLTEYLNDSIAYSLQQGNGLTI